MHPFQLKLTAHQRFHYACTLSNFYSKHISVFTMQTLSNFNSQHISVFAPHAPFPIETQSTSAFSLRMHPFQLKLTAHQRFRSACTLSNFNAKHISVFTMHTLSNFNSKHISVTLRMHLFQVRLKAHQCFHYAHPFQLQLKAHQGFTRHAPFPILTQSTSAFHYACNLPPRFYAQALTHPSKGLVLSGNVDDTTRNSLQYVFAFSAVWGIGGNMSSACWDKWDPFVRELFEGTANFPGGSGTVFDYFLDPNR